MPPLHRYVGTPVTTWILNRLYGSRFTDIHCGMRCISTDALQRMGLASQSWEYASEMVLKSVLMELRTTEVPVTFYRLTVMVGVSHHKRSAVTFPVLSCLDQPPNNVRLSGAVLHAQARTRIVGSGASSYTALELRVDIDRILHIQFVFGNCSG